MPSSPLAVVIETNPAKANSSESQLLPDLLVNNHLQFDNSHFAAKKCHSCTEGEKPKEQAPDSSTRLTEEIDRELNAIIKITLSGKTATANNKVTGFIFGPFSFLFVLGADPSLERAPFMTIVIALQIIFSVLCI